MPSNPPMVLPSNEAEIESVPNSIGAHIPASYGAYNQSDKIRINFFSTWRELPLY
jgi:hypothetical protein